MRIPSIAAVFAAGILWIVPCCQGPGSPPEYENLGSTEAGEVVLQSLKSQGYPKWARSGSLLFKLRSRKGTASDSVTTVETYTCDLLNHRVHAVGGDGASIVERTYAGGAYRQTREGEIVQDPAVLVEGRRNLLRDYFFSVLPFFTARAPSEMKLLERERFEGIPFDVVEVRFDQDAFLPPDRGYKLYFRATTLRLEKVLFQARGGDREGQYLWCEYDNYARINGALIPVHRTFYPAEDEKGRKTGEAYLEQWLMDAALQGGVDETLFPPE